MRPDRRPRPRRKSSSALRRSLELDRSRLVTHQRIAAGDRSLQARRMISDSDALKSRAEADEIESRVAAGEARLYQIAYDRLRDETLRDRASLKRKLAVREAETRLELLEARFKRDTRIVSPYAGKVVDLLITPHAAVEKGTAAALLRPRNAAPGALEAILFVPAGLGKKIRVGDAVEVAPDTVRRQEHGFIRGEVRSVSEIPCTDQAMLAELKHPALVASFVEKYRGQVLLTIHGALREAPSSHDRGRQPLAAQQAAIGQSVGGLPAHLQRDALLRVDRGGATALDRAGNALVQGTDRDRLTESGRPERGVRSEWNRDDSREEWPCPVW